MSITVPFMHDQGDTHVPSMTIHAALDENEFGKFALAAPLAAAADTFQDAVATAANAVTMFAPALEIDPAYGRTVSLKSVGAGTITIYGTDFLGQRISEVLTLTANTAEDTLKAFKTVDKIVNGTAAGNLSVGLGAHFAMPFVLQELVKYYVDGTVGATGATVAADTTNPATSETGDPRGLWKPAGGVAPNGVRNYEVYCKFNSSEAVGGLHGFASV